MAENPGFEPEVQVLPVQKITNASPSWLAAKMRAICGFEEFAKGPNWGPKHAPIHWICRVSHGSLDVARDPFSRGSPSACSIGQDPGDWQPCLLTGLDVKRERWKN